MPPKETLFYPNYIVLFLIVKLLFALIADKLIKIGEDS